jgi:hypothetical protein
LKYIGVSTETLGWILVGVLLAAFIAWAAVKRPWAEPTPATAGGVPEGVGGLPPVEGGGSVSAETARGVAAGGAET